MQAERSLYNNMVSEVKTIYHDTGLAALEPNAPCSRMMTMMTIHYSFDFVQQVHLPSNAQQPGPIYCLVPRKCALFGVCCEEVPRQRITTTDGVSV